MNGSTSQTVCITPKHLTIHQVDFPYKLFLVVHCTGEVIIGPKEKTAPIFLYGNT